jgi:catechol 2,3-dioxygenase-like lactoylglutathione lyase family enzyme
MATLSGIALECPDPEALAEFYGRLLDRPVETVGEDWCSVEVADGLHLSFQRAAGHVPPVWPDPASSMQFHLHLRVEDLDAGERLVLRLGGVKLAPQTDPGRHRVFADPAGHPFCLCPRPRSR